MSLVDTQRSIEYMYDKSRISKMIEKDINTTPVLVDQINKCVQLLSTVYLMGPHFTQKGNYLSNVTSTVLRVAVYRVLEAIMPLKNGCTFSTLVGLSSSALKTADKLDSFKVISSVISYMYFTGLVKIIRPGDSKTGMLEVIPSYICDEKIIKYIKQSMYLPPMVCAPRVLEDNKSCGYLTKNSESLILRNYNHHDEDICLDTLNNFNNVAYSLDIKMLTTFNEEPKKVIDTPDKQKQFNTLREDSYDVYKLLIQSGNNFHFTHKVDKRGRIYCCGFHVNSQGNSFRKCILNLARQELVNGTF